MTEEDNVAPPELPSIDPRDFFDTERQEFWKPITIKKVSKKLAMTLPGFRGFEDHCWEVSDKETGGYFAIKVDPDTHLVRKGAWSRGRLASGTINDPCGEPAMKKQLLDKIFGRGRWKLRDGVVL